MSKILIREAPPL